MNNKYFTYLKNILIPCTFISALAGAFTGVLIYFFKLAAEKVIALSEKGYEFIRANPQKFPWLIIFAVLLSLVSSLILKFSKNCRGGGIPTSVAILRGLISFNWIKSIFLLFISALSTYLCGVPLGNEGPSVQMGTAVGKGTAKMFPKKHSAWNRYIMTGGASAGFATATGAPVSGIFFALEEAHRRFTPMIIMVASTAVISGTAIMELLCSKFGTSSKLFDIPIFPTLSIRYIWITIIVGLVCGICAGAFTKLYSIVNSALSNKFSKIPFTLKIMSVFILTAVLGFFFSESLGSGHDLIDEILDGRGAWHMLGLFLLIRLVLLVFANNVGVAGGLFIPTLTFGALIGALVAKAVTSLEIFPSEHYTAIIIIAIASFMSAFVRTPITAIIFSVEALGAFNNILHIITAVTISYVVIELTAQECFYDTVIESKVKQENMGKTPEIIDDFFTVQSGSFIVGKEIRDILWPPSCTILSVQKKGSDKAHSSGGIDEGDVLRIYVTTYDRPKTIDALESILGKA